MERYAASSRRCEIQFAAPIRVISRLGLARNARSLIASAQFALPTLKLATARLRRKRTQGGTRHAPADGRRSAPSRVSSTRPVLRRHRGGVDTHEFVDARMAAAIERDGEVRLDHVQQPQAVKHQRAVKLHQVGAGADLFQRCLGRIDAADADERNGSPTRHLLRQHRVERANSGRPDRPPGSCAAGRAGGGRAIVVLETMTPSIPLSSTSAAMSSSSASCRSGAIFRNSGVAPAGLAIGRARRSPAPAVRRRASRACSRAGPACSARRC